MNIEWTIRFPFIIAVCQTCRQRIEIEFPTPTLHIRHCGVLRTRIPEKVLENWRDVRDMNRKTTKSGRNVRATVRCARYERPVESANTSALLGTDAME
jgi:hypothetical protein